MSDRRGKSQPGVTERRLPFSDRREAPRYVANGTAALIGWNEGQEQRTTAARLVDISMGGFAAWVEAFPPRGGPVLLRLEGEPPSPWIKAAIVATSRRGWPLWTRRIVRLRFLEVCPYDFFKAAIEHFAAEFRYDDDMPYDGFDARHWR
jgi:hypothetical protein